tara:strand:+ start:1366 stop:3132 length:1767 start_codon:yes stop_codon:yes gene_type:complete
MDSIYSHYRLIVAESCLKSSELSFENSNKSKISDILSLPFIVEKPNNENFGDLSTNIALISSKFFSKKPIEIAEYLKRELIKLDDFEEINIVKPGFINFKLKHKVLISFLRKVINKKKLISESIGKGKSINVEYVSANPTGPLHVGHCRGAVYGDVLSTLLVATGHQVTKEYYVNDAGSQIDLLAKSAIIRYKELFNGPNKYYPEDFYPGEYLISVAKELKKQFGEKLISDDSNQYFDQVKEKTVSMMLVMIKNDLKNLNINQDIFVSELELVKKGKIDEAINELKEQDLIYHGTLEQPKGKVIEDWEPREQMLFKSSLYGDEVDRPLQKSNGEWTYFANDIAYHFDKYKRGSDHLIDILGADHGGYVKRMNASVKALTSNRAEFTAKLCQMVKLTKNGKQLKMSKRAGDFITLEDMISEVGSDSIRFMMMYRKNEAPLEFDFDKVTEQSKDNPVFYVQYAHARISSVLRKLDNDNEYFDLNDFSECKLELLTSNQEIDLIRKILDWESVIETSVTLFEPHRIAYYLYELSAVFHSLWNQGKIDSSLRFIEIENDELSYARIGLILSAQRTIKSGLDILGVSAPNEMK